jgi:hypothetical protein
MTHLEAITEAFRRLGWPEERIEWGIKAATIDCIGVPGLQTLLTSEIRLKEGCTLEDHIGLLREKLSQLTPERALAARQAYYSRHKVSSN